MFENKYNEQKSALIEVGVKVENILRTIIKKLSLGQIGKMYSTELWFFLFFGTTLHNKSTKFIKEFITFQRMHAQCTLHTASKDRIKAENG